MTNTTVIFYEKCLKMPSCAFRKCTNNSRNTNKVNGETFHSIRNASPMDLEHAGKLLAELAQLRRDGTYCDVLLQVESSKRAADGEAMVDAQGVRAHSAVLAAASPFFYALFNISYEKCALPVIVIKDVDLETIRALVENIYSAQSLMVSVEKAKALLKAATRLEVDDVKDAACACLTQALAADNVLGILATAELHACATLAATAERYIDEHFDYVLRANEILGLAPNALIALLNRDRLAAIEQHVFDAVLRWTQHQPQERRRHLSCLLGAVRLRLVPQQVLAQRASIEPLATERRALFQIIEALSPDHTRLESHALTAATKSVKLFRVAESLTTEATALHPVNRLQIDVVLAADHTQPEHHQPTASSVQLAELHQIAETSAADHVRPEVKPTKLLQIDETVDPDCQIAQSVACVQQQQSPTALLVLGGWTGSQSMNAVLVCSLPDGCWQPTATLPSPRDGAGAAVLNGHVYLVGGFNNDHVPVDTVFVYDVAKDSWSTGPKMIRASSLLGVAALEGRLYALGGNDGKCRAKRPIWAISLNSALDPREGVWRALAPMALSRRGLGVAALQGRLYAVGGYNNTGNLNSVERYDPTADKWETVESMEYMRWGVGVGVVNDVMFAVGGKAGSADSSVEQYRAGLGWTTAPSMATPRYNAAVTSYRSQLYVVGGRNNYQRLPSVLMLDPATAMWSELPPLPSFRSSAAAVVVDWTPKETQ